jgi:hypothetical protein
MKKKSLTSVIKDKLTETMEWYVPPQHIPSNKKLYYEAIRIRKAIEKYYKSDRRIKPSRMDYLEKGAKF